ncbi:MAG: hypothetical protein U0Q22_01455 [Acidimicrobiales bacterium]
MRNEMLISTTEATTASARASMQRCLAYATDKWFDIATGIKHAGFNVVSNPAHGPGGTS